VNNLYYGWYTALARAFESSRFEQFAMHFTWPTCAHDGKPLPLGCTVSAVADNVRLRISLVEYEDDSIVAEGLIDVAVSVPTGKWRGPYVDTTIEQFIGVLVSAGVVYRGFRADGTSVKSDLPVPQTPPKRGR